MVATTRFLATLVHLLQFLAVTRSRTGLEWETHLPWIHLVQLDMASAGAIIATAAAVAGSIEGD